MPFLYVMFSLCVLVPALAVAQSNNKPAAKPKLSAAEKKAAREEKREEKRDAKAAAKENAKAAAKPPKHTPPAADSTHAEPIHADSVVVTPASSMLVASASATSSAATPTPTATPAPVDPASFHTSSYFRLSEGEFVVIPAQTRLFQVLDTQTFRPVVDPMTGKPKVLPNEIYLYDAKTPLDKISVSGANYAVLADKTLVAFSSTWDKPIPKSKLTTDIDTYGGNFMIKRGTREIMTVSATGYVNFGTAVIAPQTRLVGGNYFIDRANELWTIDAKGFVYNASKIVNLSYPGAILVGGNYFYQQDGSVVTIGSDGLPRPAFRPESKPALLGGNYYIGDDGVIYTIAYDGTSYKNGKSLGITKHFGYSFIIYQSGEFIAVDGMGVVHTDGIRVNSQKSKYTQTNKLDVNVDLNSIYTPNSRK